MLGNVLPYKKPIYHGNQRSNPTLLFLDGSFPFCSWQTNSTRFFHMSQRELATYLDSSHPPTAHASQQPLTSTSPFDNPLVQSSVQPVPPVIPPPRSTDITSRFSLASDCQLQEAKDSSVSMNTAKTTAWSLNIWKEWSKHRQALHPGAYSEWPIHL